MKTSATYTSLLLSLLLTDPAYAATEQGSLTRCQSIENNIQRYTEKRRQGGSSGQMNRWQKKRNHYKSLYSRYNCKKYRLQFR